MYESLFCYRKIRFIAFGGKINYRKTYAVKLCCLIPMSYDTQLPLQ